MLSEREYITHEVILPNIGINFFDAILYINLDHRNDRKERILNQLLLAGAHKSKIFRIDAQLDPLNGHRGCGLSHVKAINFAIKKQFETVLILEDDFIFTHTKESIDSYIDSFITHMGEMWDVFLLSSNVIDYEKTSHPNIKRVLCAQTTHSYALNNHYFDPLKKCFEFALSMMESDIFAIQTAQNLHAIDHVWKILQPKARWFIGSNAIGKQGESFSDISLDHIKRLDKYEYP
ncbi:MAG: glycosyltransferase family 25 protein [Rhabdochlamydiaceae bacterium]|nr:glycosyltransferase family 25 protein [Candidatus Amphrikana amoebophyrae]